VVAVEITGTEQRQAWVDDVFPPVEQVRPGLWSVPVPIPKNPLRYVLVYVLELDDGVAIVDAGWDTDEAWEALCGGLGRVGVDVRDVRAVLVTHIHPDHYGLAGRVREASGGWVALHPADADALNARYGDMDGLLDSMRALLEECGVPADEVARLSQASMGIRQFVDLTLPDVLLEDGATPQLPGWDLTALWTPGHSPGHLCFYDRRRRLLLSGDHVLPRISPNIAVHAQQRLNPLADFLDALQKVRELPVDEVLPAHEWRFAGLAGRVDDLLGHHDARLTEIEVALRATPGLTCWELTTRLTWSVDWGRIADYMRRAANGETLAHLVYLEAQGRVARTGRTPVRWSVPEGAARTHEKS
jgi:glyoxylase-like metal-dependent hydrolase (beta-lactamase superfamily II)